MAKESKNTTTGSPEIPVFGQPVFKISENPLSNRVSVMGESGYTNSLVYYAVDAVKVLKLEYADETLKKIIINKGMVDPNDETKSLEIRYDVEKNFSRDNDAASIFVDEEAANLVAARLNKSRKAICEQMSNAIIRGISEYDKIIAICEGRN